MDSSGIGRRLPTGHSCILSQQRGADIDEPLLKEIAKTTGGQYFRAENLQELSQIYLKLDELEPVEADIQTFRPEAQLYHWPLAIALLCMMLSAFMYRRGQHD